VYAEPGQTEQWVGALYDLQTVRVLSEQQGTSDRDSWRKVEFVINPEEGIMGTGWVSNLALLDNCEGGAGSFGCLPVNYQAGGFVQGFGPTYTAWATCHDNKNFIPSGIKYGDGEETGVGGCNYSHLRGLHNGLDFEAPDGSALVWVGTGNGRVVTTGGTDGFPAILIEYGGKYVNYGHTAYATVEKDDIIRPGQTIGFVIAGERHSHIGVRGGEGNSWFYNPLEYFTPDLQSRIVSTIGPSGYATEDNGVPVNWGPYSMKSFQKYTLMCLDTEGKRVPHSPENKDICSCDPGTNFWQETVHGNVEWSP
jgi:hypothetical protein